MLQVLLELPSHATHPAQRRSSAPVLCRAESQHIRNDYKDRDTFSRSCQNPQKHLHTPPNVIPAARPPGGILGFHRRLPRWRGRRGSDRLLGRFISSKPPHITSHNKRLQNQMPSSPKCQDSILQAISFPGPYRLGRLNANTETIMCVGSYCEATLQNHGELTKEDGFGS